MSDVPVEGNTMASTQSLADHFRAQINQDDLPTPDAAARQYFGLNAHAYWPTENPAGEIQQAQEPATRPHTWSISGITTGRTIASSSFRPTPIYEVGWERVNSMADVVALLKILTGRRHFSPGEVQGIEHLFNEVQFQHDYYR